MPQLVGAGHSTGCWSQVTQNSFGYAKTPDVAVLAMSALYRQAEDQQQLLQTLLQRTIELQALQLMQLISLVRTHAAVNGWFGRDGLKFQAHQLGW